MSVETLIFNCNRTFKIRLTFFESFLKLDSRFLKLTVSSSEKGEFRKNLLSAFRYLDNVMRLDFAALVLSHLWEQYNRSTGIYQTRPWRYHTVLRLHVP